MRKLADEINLKFLIRTIFLINTHFSGLSPFGEASECSQLGMCYKRLHTKTFWISLQLIYNHFSGLSPFGGTGANPLPHLLKIFYNTPPIKNKSTLYILHFLFVLLPLED